MSDFDVVQIIWKKIKLHQIEKGFVIQVEKKVLE